MSRSSSCRLPSQCPRQIAPRAHRRAVCLLGLVLLVLLAGCGRAQQANPATQDSFAVALTTDPASPVEGAATIIVVLYDAAGQPVNDAKLAIEANMSHVGMTPVYAQIGRGEDGVYRVPLTWTMGGDWLVDVRFTLSEGQVIGRRFPVRVQAK